MNPPSQVEEFLSAFREPLFAAGTLEYVGGHAEHAPVTAVLTCRLHPDVSQPSSPPLLMFAFIIETVVGILRRFPIRVEFKGNSRNSTDMGCAQSRSLCFTAVFAAHELV